MEFPSPEQIKKKLPLSNRQAEFVFSSRAAAKKLLKGEDERLLIIAGPCSLHHWEASLEYAKRFKDLSEKVKSSCLLIMRGYIEKSRTRNQWKGLIHDPDLNESYDLEKGILLARELLLEFTKKEIPIATEFVSPLLVPYIEDLITWGFIGARTCSSQVHRQMVSMLSFPVGFKNSLDGNVDCAIDGILSARAPHTFLHINESGSLCKTKSDGNLFTHVVHRGARDSTNFDSVHVAQTLAKLKYFQLPQKLMIDCAHGNSQKNPSKQREVFYQILDQIAQGNRHIFGIMLESYLEEGSQVLADLSMLKGEISITDPCIDWAATEEMIQSVEGCFVSSMVSSSFT